MGVGDDVGPDSVRGPCPLVLDGLEGYVTVEGQ